MSTVVSTSVGFYKMPITKTLLSSVLLTSSALNVPIVYSYRHLFICNINDIVFRHKLWQILISKICMPDVKDLVCGSLLLYYLRVFERRYGSNKYASYLLSCFTVSLFLEISMVFTLNAFNIIKNPNLMSGPFNIIFALLVNYYIDIPALKTTQVLGLPINTKTLTYILGFQTMITSTNSMICGISGIIAGLICRYNVCKVCNYIKIPKSIASFVAKWLGPIVVSSPPIESPIQMGATAEIQRQQQIEIVEQQMLLSSFTNINQRNNLNQTNNTRFNNLNAQTSSLSPDSESISSPDNLHVTALVDMGFDRQHVVRALQRSNNDINLATNLLLNET
ncbi:ubiquitin-associated domain-containing protein 2-like [Oppia nitens]|uniref:ubiquitin-associated domain-containing protein 2-like n=1 Tax=Oppia nitens TaxID=1686743 RepID=UPI0023DBB950|nr:ubiquitin-associated domain-containing protein 2-like [Oppia nitens]